MDGDAILYLKSSNLNYQLYKIVNPKNMEYTHELRTKGKVGSSDYFITVRLNYLSPKALAKREADRKKKEQEKKINDADKKIVS